MPQEQDGCEKVIGYYSRSLTKSERSYCVTHRELLAVVDSLKHFHPYLYGVPFVIRSDHGSLRYFLNFRNLEGQLCRWSEYYNSYNFKLIHRPGRLHGNTDGMFRRPCLSCSYCDKVEKAAIAEEQMTECCRQVKTLDREDVFQNWVKGKTSSEIQETQCQDICIGKVKSWKESGQRPKWKNISHESSLIKAYWSQWDRLLLQDGILYGIWWELGKKKPAQQLILPDSLRSLVLTQLHSQATSGHLGTNRTIA